MDMVLDDEWYGCIVLAVGKVRSFMTEDNLRSEETSEQEKKCREGERQMEKKQSSNNKASAH